MNARDRLDPQFFAADEPVGIAAVRATDLPGPIDSGQWSYVSERLLTRLLKIGAAYELHFSGVIEPVIDTVLDRAQCQSLCDELSLLADIVHDAALHAAISAIVDRANVVAQHSEMRLVLSPP